ncbi:hypothetical protein ACT3SP_18090 [Brachybacterium sp. AOP43-C2-M15]|uniref:hypothetical protein n=1 Tax=Brachybacterium sp. AOP43-C2-M15 TaxID=3457661 RepID=UPI004033413D
MPPSPASSGRRGRSTGTVLMLTTGVVLMPWSRLRRRPADAAAASPAADGSAG